MRFQVFLVVSPKKKFGKNYLNKNAIEGLIDGLDNVKSWVSRMDNRVAVNRTNKISSEFSWEVEPSIDEIADFAKN